MISDRHGLYSIDKSEPSPLAPSEKEDLKPRPPSVNPHRIFLKVNSFYLNKNKTGKNLLFVLVRRRANLSLHA